MHAQKHPFDTAGLTTRFFLTESPDISQSDERRKSRSLLSLAPASKGIAELDESRSNDLRGDAEIPESAEPDSFYVHGHSLSPRVPQRDFGPLGGLILALFVAACFWGGVYELAKWLVKVL